MIFNSSKTVEDKFRTKTKEIRLRTERTFVPGLCLSRLRSRNGWKPQQATKRNHVSDFRVRRRGNGFPESSHPLQFAIIVPWGGGGVIYITLKRNSHMALQAYMCYC